MVNLSAADFARKKNKHLASIAEWVAGHGGGAVIPFSVEWEQQWHALRDDEAGRAAFQASTDTTCSRSWSTACAAIWRRLLAIPPTPTRRPSPSKPRRQPSG